MLNLKKASCLLLLGLTLLTTRTARADDASDPKGFKFEMFDFNPKVAVDQRWTVELQGTGLADVTSRHVAMYGITAGAGYYFFQNLAIVLDVTGYGYNEGHTNGAAAGVTLGLRHHLFSIGKTQFIGEVSGGEIEASNNLPLGGTHLNNTLITGLTIAQPISDTMYLTAGVRYFHISNARAEGVDRNPSINAIQGVFGVMWRF